MSDVIAWLTTINSTDPDLRRRGRNLVILAIGMAILASAFILFIIGRPTAAVTIPLLLAATGAFIGIAFLGRAGLVTPGAWLMVGVIVIVIFTSLLTNRGATAGAATPFYLVFAILLAGVLLPPVHIFTALGIALAGLALVTGLADAPPDASAELRQSAINGSLMLMMVAVISFVSARGTTAALREAEAARHAADDARKELAATNANLERRVEERTIALRQIADEQRATTTALAASLRAQEDLNRIIADQAVPVIPVSDGTLVVPLIGNISAERADQILATILSQVERSRASTVVLDVTGVAVVDTHVAAGLLRVAQATRLMGTTTVLAGIRPEVAQALVGLGVDLVDLRTVATLKEAL